MRGPEYSKFIAEYQSKLVSEASNVLSVLGISRNNFYTGMDEFKSASIKLVEESFKRELMHTNLKALDAFEKEFIVDKNDYEHIYKSFGEGIIDSTDNILELRLRNLNIPLENLLLASDKRYCVMYHSDKAKIVNMPIDIFRYLIRNKCGESVINPLINNTVNVRYNIIDIYNKALKLGPSFEEKLELMGKDKETNIFSYLNKKYNNNIRMGDLTDAYCDKFGYMLYNVTIDRCKNWNICFTEVLNRVVNKNMTPDDAIQLGMEERNKYGLDNFIKDDLRQANKLVDIFYALVREQIKESSK